MSCLMHLLHGVSEPAGVATLIDAFYTRPGSMSCDFFGWRAHQHVVVACCDLASEAVKEARLGNREPTEKLIASAAEALTHPANQAF